MLSNLDNRRSQLTNLANDIKNKSGNENDATCQAVIALSYQAVRNSASAQKYFSQVKKLAESGFYVNSLVSLSGSL
jgi:hypothetical protein